MPSRKGEEKKNPHFYVEFIASQTKSCQKNHVDLMRDRLLRRKIWFVASKDSDAADKNGFCVTVPTEAPKPHGVIYERTSPPSPLF
jgi:hypothetical protein